MINFKKNLVKTTQKMGFLDGKFVKTTENCNFRWKIRQTEGNLTKIRWAVCIEKWHWKLALKIPTAQWFDGKNRLCIKNVSFLLISKVLNNSQYFSELLQYFSAIIKKYCNIAPVFCAIFKKYCNIAQYCALFLQYFSIIKKTHSEA